MMICGSSTFLTYFKNVEGSLSEMAANGLMHLCVTGNHR